MIDRTISPKFCAPTLRRYSALELKRAHCGARLMLIVDLVSSARVLPGMHQDYPPLRPSI
ncbi:MAG: hypothetical protein AAGC56_12980 [Pseudomonadota bacterium]